MERRRTRTPRFSARIEQLEDRRVMAASTFDAAALVYHDLDELLPVAAAPAELPPLDHHLADEPDFWINASDTALEDAFDQVEQTLSEAHQQTGWLNVRANYGLTGRGQTVAVIDSGVAYRHFALGGGLGANYRVVGGWDFTEENDADPDDDGAKGGHGTHVAGIIGSNSASHTGVAPGVDIVGLRVFNDAGAGYFSWVEKALRWVYDNRDAYANPITTVNLSLGVSSWNAATIPQWANLEDEFAKLESAGIFIAVSAGNSFSSYNAAGLSYPAASPYVVPVMSTDDGGALSAFSQRYSRAIAAPGRSITSTVPDYKGDGDGLADDFATMSGTSMAAPYIAGASVLIREAMQRIGMTNITQDAIYDHMMATADTVYDAVTRMSYKRLDLEAAIDALMPADDYGSTMAVAHNLGALSGTAAVSGALGTLTDADYFRFTAAASGSVTFAMSSTAAGLTPSWQAYRADGQPISARDGDSVTFSVTAGQTYAVRLTAASGSGRYAFNATAAAAFSFEDLGSVDYRELSRVTVAGETWHRVVATRDGMLTTVASFDAAHGSVDLDLYDANRQLLSMGASTDDSVRVDAQVRSGEVYYLRIAGAATAVDLKLLNLVAQSGTTVNVVGTAGDDVFSMWAGVDHRLSVNGVEYLFSSTAAKAFAFDGGAGADSIVMVGSAATETGLIHVGAVNLIGKGYAAAAVGVETITLHGGGGTSDLVRFLDSAGDDTLIVRPAEVVLSGVGFRHAAHGFAHADAFAMQGDDRAELYDGAGDDLFQARLSGSSLKGVGHSSFVAGFDSVSVHSTAGGVDMAELWDSMGDDVFTARPTYATLRTPAMLTSAHGFESVYGYASHGGRDHALLYDSPQDDVFVSRPGYTYVRGAGFYNFAKGFESVRSYATAGGVDASWLFGSAGDDTAIFRGDQAWLYGAGFDVSAHGFEKTNVAGMGGADVARLQDLDSRDAVYGAGNVATLTRGGRSARVEDFDRVIAAELAGLAASIDVRAIDYLFERLNG